MELEASRTWFAPPHREAREDGVGVTCRAIDITHDHDVGLALLPKTCGRDAEAYEQLALNEAETVA